MKKHLFFYVTFFISFPIFAIEPTEEQKQALFMLNYSQYVTYKLKTYNNILSLDDEYQNLKDNMNFQTIKDSDSVDTINKLLDSIHAERKNHENRERLEFAVERKMNRALYNSIPQITTIVSGGANPLSVAINAASVLGRTFVGYQQYKSQLSEEYDEKMFEFKNLTADILNDIYTDLNLYTFNLVKKYNISDDWRLNERELEELFKYTKDTDRNRTFTNLKNMSTGRYVNHFPMFWYHIAQAAYYAGDEVSALKYYNKFEKENIKIFRYDRIAVDAYKVKINILLKNQKSNEKEIREKLKFIENNKNTWSDYYFCALVYSYLKDVENAKRILEKNISELAAEIDIQLSNTINLKKIYEINDLSIRNYYTGFELSRILLHDIDKNDASYLNSIKNRYENGTQAINEFLHVLDDSSLSSSTVNDYKNKVLVTSKVLSEKKCKIDVTLPIQWVISSDSELLAVFYNGKAEVEVTMYLDYEKKESWTKVLKRPISFLFGKKESGESEKLLKECNLTYTTGEINLDWKKKGYNLKSVKLSHKLYPVQFHYNLNLNKPVKFLKPDRTS